MAYFGKDARYRNGYVEQFLRDGVRDVNLGHMDDPVRFVFPSESFFFSYLKISNHPVSKVASNMFTTFLLPVYGK